MNSASTAAPRPVSPKQNSEARLRLYCFPYAGAGASVFREWAPALPAAIEVIPVQLPGRESRIRETPLTSLRLLVDTLIAEITDLNTPFAFFGHSMGALVSFELARKLREDGKRTPVHLFVSGRRAPTIRDEVAPLHKSDDRTLLEKLRELNGTPEEVFQYPELVGFWLRIIRADLEACETYVYSDAVPLECPITVFGGLDDAHVSRDEMVPWGDQTRGVFSLHMLPGDHFFLHSSREILLHTIVRNLSEAMVLEGSS